MEDRLVPINALIGLVTPHDVNPSPLADMGYRLAALEVPVVTPEGKVVIDVVLYRKRPNRLIVCESKSGANIEPSQARRYAALPVNHVVQGARVDLSGSIPPSQEVIYACLEAHAERIVYGLKAIDVAVPVIVIGNGRITLQNSDYAGDDLLQAFSAPLLLRAPVTRYIPFDHDSPLEIIIPPVRAALVQALARKRPQVSLTALTEECTHHYALYTHKIQGKLRKRVEEAARYVCDENPDMFELVPRGNNHDGMVRILDHPEARDRRGRTQVYKKLSRRGGGLVEPHSPMYVQPDLLDLLEEAEQPDVETLAQEEEGTL